MSMATPTAAAATNMGANMITIMVTAIAMGTITPTIITPTGKP